MCKLKTHVCTMLIVYIQYLLYTYTHTTCYLHFFLHFSFINPYEQLCATFFMQNLLLLILNYLCIVIYFVYIYYFLLKCIRDVKQICCTRN